MSTPYEYTWAAWVEAFSILAKYEPDTHASVVTEHEEIWIGHDIVVSDEDKARLEELGWSYDDDLQCFNQGT